MRTQGSEPGTPELLLWALLLVALALAVAGSGSSRPTDFESYGTAAS
jgi:hypothetical protein